MTEWLVSNAPADPNDELGRFPVADAAAVDAAVERARRAFPAWRDAGLEARAGVLRRFAALASERAPELADLIAREVGKALWDARGEANLLAAKIAVTLEEGMQLVATHEAAPGARATYHPRGVLAVLGPFNFPAHLPNGHIVPALATGNTVVFKPSEWTPACGAWMAALWKDAGLPDGVLEIVHGEAATGSALAVHPDIDAVLFTGSWATGRALQEATLDQPDKLLALELGGRNAIAVLDDGDLELAIAESALSIAVTTGQRCSCASRLFVHRSLVDEYQERLARVLKGLVIGAPLDVGVFMGPLVSQAAYDKVQSMRALSAEAGGERIVEVDPIRPAPFIGAGLVRFAGTDQSHAYQREEIFGPEACLYAIDDIDEAIACINDSEYGLVASVFTSDRACYDRAVGRVRTGLLNWNKGTTGASGKLPFGGEGRSGNDRPAGVTATLYTTRPQAHLESEAAFDPDSLPPGVPQP